MGMGGYGQPFLQPPLRLAAPGLRIDPVTSYSRPWYSASVTPTGGMPTGNKTYFGANSVVVLNVSPTPMGGIAVSNRIPGGTWGIYQKRPTYGRLSF